MSYEDEKAKKVDFNNRKCRDVLWLVIFFLFVVGMFVVMGIGLSRGDYKRVTNGMDYRGCICGTKMSVPSDSTTCEVDDSAPELGSKSTFVQFLDTSKWGSNVYIMCTASCPSVNGQLYCADSSAANGVLVGTGDDLVAQTQSIADAKCSGNAACSWITSNCAVSYDSKSYVGYCLPSSNTSFVDAANSVLGSESWTRAFASIEKGAWIIFACLIIAVVLAFVYMKLMEYFAAPLTWIALIAIFVGMLASGYFLYDFSNSIKATYTGANAEGYKDDLQWQMSFYGSIATFIVTAIYLLIVCCLVKKIILAIKCVELAGDAIGDMRMIVFFPIVTTVLGLGTFAIWCVTAVYLFSAGTVEAVSSPSSLVPEGLLKKYTWDSTIQYAGIYHLFGLFWTTQFILAFGELVIAYAVVRWYFSETENGSRKTPMMPILTACKSVISHHLGSIALGSLLIAIIQMIRAIVEYIHRKAPESSKQNPVWKFVMCCCKCWLWCLEKCMRFVNRQAYIQIALSGESFCTSCFRAFYLILRNAAAIGALKLVATIFVFLGKLVIMVASTAICYLILTQVSTYSNQSLDTAVPNAFVPCALVAVMTYFLASLFMSVYSQTISTLLMCFVHDKEAYPPHGQYHGGKLAEKINTMNKSAVDAGVTANRGATVKGSDDNYY